MQDASLGPPFLSLARQLRDVAPETDRLHDDCIEEYIEEQTKHVAANVQPFRLEHLALNAEDYTVPDERQREQQQCLRPCNPEITERRCEQTRNEDEGE